MRWEGLLARSSTEEAQLPLGLKHATSRTFPTPAFAGMTFYEIQAKTIINRVPSSSRMPFLWTINPYRGCTHKCRYCFARPTHDYLGLGIGDDFDSKIVVKVNAAQLLRAELAKPSWSGESIAMGTNVDPYQRAEGKYRLMREILGALAERGNPFSILTKGTLILRDLDLITQASKRARVSVGVSIGSIDTQIWRAVEAGAPSPSARLGVCRTFIDAGVQCTVLMAPILPYLTDSDDHLEASVAAIANAGVTSITPLVLHLRPGVREWFMSWLQEQRPHLVGAYERLYAQGAYAPRDYAAAISGRVASIAQAYGVPRKPQRRSREELEDQEQEATTTTQLSLL